MENGIKKIHPIESIQINSRILIFAMLKDLGCSVSSIPNHVEGNKAYTDDWEYFNPERVANPDELPEHWRMVHELHNKPEMQACRDMRYKYVHCPEEILSSYLSLPCKGIFCLTADRPWNGIRGKDLVHIGSELL